MIPLDMGKSQSVALGYLEKMNKKSVFFCWKLNGNLRPVICKEGLHDI